MSVKNATEPIIAYAKKLAAGDEGTACTQSSFKRDGKSFLYIGQQGGRHKAMFKLGASREMAEQLAAESPDDFQVGSTAWVTARFSDAAPLAKSIWKQWLEESYALADSKKPASKGVAKTSGKSSSAKKKVAPTQRQKVKKRPAKKK